MVPGAGSKKLSDLRFLRNAFTRRCPDECRENPYLDERGPKGLQKFEPPDGKMIHGAGQCPSDFRDYWNIMPEETKPALYALYTDLVEGGGTFLSEPGGGRKRGEKFFENYWRLTDEFEPRPLIHVAIEMTAFSPIAIPGPYEDEVAAGRHDESIDEWAIATAEWEEPVFIRLGHEANGRLWNCYCPESYRNAFRRVVHIFRDHGADNAAFIWHLAVEWDNPLGDWVCDSDYMAYYPGDDVVDWWGASLYDYEEKILHPKTLEFLRSATERSKPVIIGETGPRFVGTSTKNARKSWDIFFKPLFGLMNQWDCLKAMSYIHTSWDYHPIFRALLHRDQRVNSSEYIYKKYMGRIKENRWLHVEKVREYLGLSQTA